MPCTESEWVPLCSTEGFVQHICVLWSAAWCQRLSFVVFVVVFQGRGWEISAGEVPSGVQREEREVRGLNAAALRWKPGWFDVDPPYLSAHRSHRGFCSVNLMIIISSLQLTTTAADHLPARPANRAKLFNAVTASKYCKIALIN